MLRIRRGNCWTNHGESSRIYPARQTTSTLCCLSAATTSRSCSSRVLPFEGMTSACNSRWRAVAMPGASALFEMTTLMRASAMRPASMLSAMAPKCEPRPERRMPRLCMTSARSVIDYFALTLDDAPHGDSLLRHAFQDGLGLLEFRQRNYQEHSQSHVESTQHLFLRNISQLP